MLMPGRSYNSAGYRYGYNTQEKDDEISGSGNHTTAEYWEYDTRLGRRWNLDPVPFNSISRYATNFNNPVLNTDPFGDVGGKYESKRFERQAKKNSDYKDVTRKKIGDRWVVSYDIKTDARDKYDGAQAGVERFGHAPNGIESDGYDVINDFIQYALPKGVSDEVNKTDGGGQRALNETYAGAFAKFAATANPLVNVGLLATGQNISGNSADGLDKTSQVLGLIPTNPLAQFEGQSVSTILKVANAEGVYIVVLKNGKKYVGMSVDIARRLKQHLYKPKWLEEDIESITGIIMQGSTPQERRQMEQNIMDFLRKEGDELLNLINAIRKK
jgi:hypothetical protein